MRDLARSWLGLPLTLLLAGCMASYVDLFPDSVSQISDGMINPSGRALPPAPFVCDTSLGERDAWFEPVTGPFRFRTKLRFLEPRLAAESLWPSVRLLLVTEDGIVAGGAQLANFLFAYVATARGANEASDEGPPRMLGVFALGDEVTFDLTWSGGGLLRVDVHPNKQGLPDFVDIELEGLPAAMVVSCQSARIEFLSMEYTPDVTPETLGREVRSQKSP